MLTLQTVQNLKYNTNNAYNTYNIKASFDMLCKRLKDLLTMRLADFLDKGRNDN